MNSESCHSHIAEVAAAIGNYTLELELDDYEAAAAQAKLAGVSVPEYLRARVLECIGADYNRNAFRLRRPRP